MTDLIIDPEFRDLLPPLPDDKRKQLEENILQNGIREPLVLWQGILIDGHNRYEIAKRHNLTFTSVEYHFNDRSDVRLWIANNQFGRRDLNNYERSLLALKIKPDIAKKAKENQAEYHGNQYESGLCQKSDKVQIDTKKEVAKLAGVSHDTIAKVEKIEAHATPEVKAAVKSGKISINEGYKQVKRAEKEAKQEERREKKSYAPPTELQDDSLKLFCADIRSGLLDIADNSVDFIITDPPYPKEYLPLLPLNRLSPVLLAALGSSSPFWRRIFQDPMRQGNYKKFF